MGALPLPTFGLMAVSFLTTAQSILTPIYFLKAVFVAA